MLEASPFDGEGYRKAWAKLRAEGIRTSQERVRRLMREHDLQASHRVGRAHGPKVHDGTITTEVPDVMWGTDMTATMTVGEGAAFVFVAVDHCTTECIGLHAAARGTRFEALEPIRQGVRERFGDIGDGIARGLRLRHDHGSNYLADDFQQEVAFFGIESSPSFVRDPEGNGVRGAYFIRTLNSKISCGCGASRPSKTSAWPCSSSIGRTTSQWMLEKYHYRSLAQVRRDSRRAGKGSVDANTAKPLSKNPGALQTQQPVPRSGCNTWAMPFGNLRQRHVRADGPTTTMMCVKTRSYRYAAGGSTGMGVSHAGARRTTHAPATGLRRVAAGSHPARSYSHTVPSLSRSVI